MLCALGGLTVTRKISDEGHVGVCFPRFSRDGVFLQGCVLVVPGFGPVAGRAAHAYGRQGVSVTMHSTTRLRKGAGGNDEILSRDVQAAVKDCGVNLCSLRSCFQFERCLACPYAHARAIDRSSDRGRHKAP